jgi:hypothetical protein
MRAGFNEALHTAGAVLLSEALPHSRRMVYARTGRWAQALLTFEILRGKTKRTVNQNKEHAE